MNKKNKRLLLFVDWFYPGYKAGGPIQSCRNIVELLNDEFEIYIFTSDRDIGDTAPYKDIDADQWATFDGNTKIFYASALSCSVKNIERIIAEIKPDTVYLNSMFSVPFTLKPLIALKKKQTPVKIILAPRGMLHRGAVKIKRAKKVLFLNLIKNIGLTKKVIFHATDLQEVADVKKYFKRSANIILAENIPHINKDAINYSEKNKGEANFIFISRVHPKKNILYFIEILSGITKHIVKLDIYGYIDDRPYEQKCKAAIAKLPNNITVTFKGPVPNHSVFQTISKYHVFVLPTLGENFGHAIFESLGAGRPVLISNQTPWHNMAVQKTGWDIPLSETGEFSKTIRRIAEWGQREFDEWCNNAYNFAQTFVAHEALKQKYTALFS